MDNDLEPKYARVILKLSGEGFGPAGKSGISLDETLSISRQAKRVVEVAVVYCLSRGAHELFDCRNG